MARVELKDGSVVDIPIQPGWGEEEVQRAIRQYKATTPAPAGAAPDSGWGTYLRHPQQPGDPAKTDSWPTYLGKQLEAIDYGGGGGLASTIDMLGNTVAVGPRAAYNWYQGKPLLSGFGGSAVRDFYEGHTASQPPPPGSSYETTSKVSQTLVPAIAETLLTGSPKTAVPRAMLDTGLGYVSGPVGDWIGQKFGGKEGGDLGRIIAGAVAPLLATGTGAKVATTKVGGPLISRALDAIGLKSLNPFNLFPPASVGRSVVGATGATSGDYNADAAAEDERRRQQELYRLQTGR